MREKSKHLRKNSTLTEVILWNELKGKKIMGYQFRRQVPMLKFIVYFYCRDLQLVIEIDGPVHKLQKRYDEKRQSELEQVGLNFLRIPDWEVKENMQQVLDKIINKIRLIEKENI